MTATAGYRMVLPDTWVRLPANPLALRPIARRLLQELWADQSRDVSFPRRRQLEEHLVALGDQAAEGGGRELLVCLEAAGDVPLPASAVISVQPTLLEGEQGLQELAAVSADGALSSEVLEVGRQRGVVVVRDTPLDAPPSLPEEGTAEQREALTAALRSVRHVDVYLPVPDEPAMLLLSFSTPLASLFEAYTELFVALAGTVQFPVDGTWL